MWQTAYIHVNEFTKLEINVETRQRFEMFLNNNKELSAYSSVAKDKKISTKTKVLNKSDFVMVNLKDLDVLPEDVTYAKSLINNDLKSKMRQSL